MWENINGELIWIDKEMGWEENERYNSVGNDSVYPVRYDRSHACGPSAGRIAVGVAGGMIAAKAVPRVGSWLLWMAGILTLIMIFM